MTEPSITLGKTTLGGDAPCFVIAEMSANHDQDLERALSLVDLAADAGVDALKVQTYRPETMTLDTDHPSARVDPVWQARNLFELYKKAYMPWPFHAPIFARARQRGLVPFSSPFDATAVELLESLDVALYKVASFELVDLPLLRDIASTHKPIIMSTGMASLGEIEEALITLEKHGAGPVVLLHCCSNYPADAPAINLRAMQTMRQAFGRPVGYSDHSVGTAVPVAAVALGACAIEKHFTDNTQRPGPDHRFSADKAVLTRMVQEIRVAEAALGSAKKHMHPSEQVSKDVGRRSIFACQAIRRGTPITAEMVRVVRPGAGLHPRHLEWVIGRPARQDIAWGEPITWSVI